MKAPTLSPGDGLPRHRESAGGRHRFRERSNLVLNVPEYRVWVEPRLARSVKRRLKLRGRLLERGIIGQRDPLEIAQAKRSHRALRGSRGLRDRRNRSRFRRQGWHVARWHGFARRCAAPCHARHRHSRHRLFGHTRASAWAAPIAPAGSPLAPQSPGRAPKRKDRDGDRVNRHDEAESTPSYRHQPISPALPLYAGMRMLSALRHVRLPPCFPNFRVLVSRPTCRTDVNLTILPILNSVVPMFELVNKAVKSFRRRKLGVPRAPTESVDFVLQYKPGTAPEIDSYRQRPFGRVRTRVHRRPTSRRLEIEWMESRIVLSPVVWTGDAGDNNWDSPNNWNPVGVPGSTADVTINIAANVVHSSSVTDTINSLTSTEPLTISGGTLSIASASTTSAALTISGGTLTGAGSLSVGGLLTLSSGTLSGSSTLAPRTAGS